jgi:rhamnosyltransferase
MIPYGVNPEECPRWDGKLLERHSPGRALELTPGRYWLVVARLEPDNMIHVIVEGHAKSRSSMPLVVVGDFSSDRYRSRVKELIETAGVSGRIIMMGSVYDHETLLMLRCHCAAYLHGHSVGGTNPSLLEAMGSGNIILAHDNPFNREVCGSDALFFSGADELGREMSSVESNMAEHAPAGVRSKQRALQRYRWESVAESYDALFESLMKHKLGR